MRCKWLEMSKELSLHPGDFYTGARKIIRAVSWSFGSEVSDDLVPADAGYTKMKMGLLFKQYYHEESHQGAVKLWQLRKAQGRYGSVGFHCYNHLTKNDPEHKAKRASVMGPCLQSVAVTYTEDRKVSVDVMYRTTELYKKFPADLIFIRDTLLPPFLDDMELKELRFYFANLTCHPMYFVTTLPFYKRPDLVLKKLQANKYFHDWAVKWTARYLCDEHHRGIEKHAQSQRVKKDARERITGRSLELLQKYLRDNHPGYRNDYVGDLDEDS